MDEMRFCDTCAQLEIAPEKFLPPAEGGPYFHKCQEPFRRLDCDLCGLVWELKVAMPFGHHALLVDDGSLLMCLDWIYPRIRASVPSMGAPCIGYELYETQYITIRPATHNTSQYPYFHRLLPQGPSFLDYGLIRGWIDQCENGHSGRCEKATTRNYTSTADLLVVDVLRKCITPAPPACRYLALSYVWGNATQLQLTRQNLNELSRELRLAASDVPATIRDAMTLVEKLGERYLWCDALCIISDDASIRQTAISNMDNIYVDSLITIVAGACVSADDPIRGVNTPRICRQHTRKLSADLSLMAHYQVVDLFKSTVYCRRAWTFQEFQLATRLLVFAPNDQVYFLCDQDSHCEDGPENSYPTAGDRLRVSNTKSEFTFSLKRRLDENLAWTNYRWAITQFSSRNLTQQADAVNALNGVLKRIGIGSCFEGLPVAFLELGLLWSGRNLKRRKEFPSWTWAGWTGGLPFCGHVVDYIPLYGPDSLTEDLEHRERLRNASETALLNMTYKHATWIVYYVWDNVRTVDQPRWLHGGQPVEGTDSAEAHAARFPGLPHNTLPTISIDRQVDRLSGKSYEGPSILHFWTASVYFDAVSREGQSSAEVVDPEGNVFGSCDLDEKDDVWGTRTHEFIVISEEGDLSFERYRNTTYYSSKKYNVIMIAWDGGIAERIGKGDIDREAVFKSCRRPMKWKEILLR